MEFYNIKTITELAQIINTTQPTISGWRSRNAVGALVEKVAEHDNKVLEYIFTSSSNTQAIQTISGGQNAQNVHGDMVGRDKVDGTACNKPNTNPQDINTQQDAGVDVAQNICKDIDPATLNLFIESYEKAKEKDDIKGLRIYLMDY